MTRTRGRHRVPTPTVSQRAGRAAAIGTVAALPAVLVPGVADAAATNWDVIIQCESGNRNIATQIPGPYTASGYLQITNGTWAAHGGLQFASRAMFATKAQQIVVAERIAARRGGLDDWNESRDCWRGKTGFSAGTAPQHSSGTEAPRHALRTDAAPRHAAPDVRAVDGSGTYVCDTAHLSYDACDPETLGRTVNYPLYSGRTAVATPQPASHPTNGGGEYVVKSGDTLTKIAAVHGTTWQRIFAGNRDVIDDPNRIYVNERIHIRTA